MRAVQVPFPTGTTHMWADGGQGRTRLTLRNQGEPPLVGKLLRPVRAAAMASQAAAVGPRGGERRKPRTRTGAMIDELLQLYEYNRWANRRTLDSSSNLTQEEFTRHIASSFSSVQETLAHMLSAEWVWLQRWLGHSPSALTGGWNLTTHPKLAEQWHHFEREQLLFLESLGEADLHVVITYRTMAGQEYSSRMWQMLRHLVNHSTYHRGQVATLLRQLGHTPAGTDLITFYRENEERPGAALPPIT